MTKVESMSLTDLISALIIFNMIQLAQTTQRTNAKPEAIFALWKDIDNWAETDKGIEWARLTDNFSAGGHYVIKPKGGPKTKATILLVEPNKRFVDISHLFGAKLQFEHSIAQQNGMTIVNIVMTLSGPLSWIWARILGKNQQADLELSTTQLIAKAERRS